MCHGHRVGPLLGEPLTRVVGGGEGRPELLDLGGRQGQLVTDLLVTTLLVHQENLVLRQLQFKLLHLEKQRSVDSTVNESTKYGRT